MRELGRSLFCTCFGYFFFLQPSQDSDLFLFSACREGDSGCGQGKENGSLDGMSLELEKRARSQGFIQRMKEETLVVY